MNARQKVQFVLGCVVAGAALLLLVAVITFPYPDADSIARCEIGYDINPFVSAFCDSTHELTNAIYLVCTVSGLVGGAIIGVIGLFVKSSRARRPSRS
jgi:uncharacterized membrane protein